MTQGALALVGAGPWGMTLGHALGQAADGGIAWICDVDGERRARAGAAHPGARLTADLDDVLADARVTAVAVAVDAARHHAVGLRVLQASRHLMVEKPMAMSTLHAAELAAAATACERVLVVGHLLLHHPAVRRAHQIVVEGVLGEPLYFESTRGTVGAPRAPGSAWWALAPHDVSLAIHLFGATPATVSASGGAFATPDHDGVASAALRFADGRIAYIHVARFAAHKTRRMSIAGTRRTLTFDELTPEAPLQIIDADGKPTRVPVDAGDPLLAQCRHFVTCARQGDVAGGNAAHALAVVRVLEAGERSMRAGGAPIELR